MADDVIAHQLLKFVPAVPTCAQVHIRYSGVTAKQVEAARDAVEKSHGIRVFDYSRQRNEPDLVVLTEVLIGSANIMIDDDLARLMSMSPTDGSKDI